MSFAPRFRQGMRAAIPIGIAFVPSSLAWGIAAQAHGLTLDEIVLLSVWVYSGPAQFAVLVPLAEGKSAATVSIAIAYKTKSAVTGMLVGVVLVLVFSSLR